MSDGWRQAAGPSPRQAPCSARSSARLRADRPFRAGGHAPDWPRPRRGSQFGPGSPHPPPTPAPGPLYSDCDKQEQKAK